VVANGFHAVGKNAVGGALEVIVGIAGAAGSGVAVGEITSCATEQLAIARLAKANTGKILKNNICPSSYQDNFRLPNYTITLNFCQPLATSQKKIKLN
jgi:hypothetical protein